ncbi:hypothetical protein P153DRAFT_380386 [Dothidotthia symphoricarpi CBS 119687]|uniref:Uncharacterized protein n=1 Tax=Dothidotthia symphoricarpi CBS 119687 TaxID=1392245 RepID=A0A6A6ARM0_9PLEO|nr:uncharacterized protein P153DRAFT_380386 [Dothidotthia symphoricarpi CBS 119687]KAF2134569.1 hypothetical protein P153DRAFT_380386 [Dothidotthia symphoricarpi CBS 119687]
MGGKEQCFSALGRRWARGSVESMHKVHSCRRRARVFAIGNVDNNGTKTPRGELPTHGQAQGPAQGSHTPPSPSETLTGPALVPGASRLRPNVKTQDGQASAGSMVLRSCAVLRRAAGHPPETETETRDQKREPRRRALPGLAHNWIWNADLVTLPP